MEGKTLDQSRLRMGKDGKEGDSRTTHLEHLQKSLLGHLDSLELLLVLDGSLDESLDVGPIGRGNVPFSEKRRESQFD